MEAPTPLADLDLLQTLAFVRSEPEPPTAADVSAALAVPRSVARWRLERLVEAGLLVPGDEAAVDVDYGMWRALVATALAQEPNGARCETHGCLATDAPCRIVVELPEHAKTAAGRIP